MLVGGARIGGTSQLQVVFGLHGCCYILSRSETVHDDVNEQVLSIILW